MTELNLDSNIKRLIIIALSKYKRQQEQAKALGITTRTLYTYIKKYKINDDTRIFKTNADSN